MLGLIDYLMSSPAIAPFAGVVAGVLLIAVIACMYHGILLFAKVGAYAVLHACMLFMLGLLYLVAMYEDRNRSDGINMQVYKVKWRKCWPGMIESYRKLSLHWYVFTTIMLAFMLLQTFAKPTLC